MKKYFMSIRLLAVKDNSHTNFAVTEEKIFHNGHAYKRTSHAVSMDKKTPKIKFCHKKKYITAEEVKIIETMSILPTCRLSVHREANYNALQWR